MTETGDPLDLKELSRELREDPTWNKTPSLIATCVQRRHRPATYINLILAMSIQLSALLPRVELILTPPGEHPLGFEGLAQVPVTLSALILAMVLVVFAFFVFASHLRFSVCHSLAMQLVIRQVGVQNAEFPEAYRRTAMVPLVRASANRWLFVLAVLASALTPAVIRLYQSTVFTELVDLLTVVNLGLVLLYGGLVSEWGTRRTLRRYERMSASDLREDARSLAERNTGKVEKWLRRSLRERIGRDLSDAELEPLVGFWYDEYFFRDEAEHGDHDEITESLSAQELPLISGVISGLGILCFALWVFISLVSIRG